MTRRFIFGVLCLATASGALGQNVRPASAGTPGPRPIARTEGRKILATLPTADAESESETDCSHLVHDVYERAGFPYNYVSSRELYIGTANFTRVRAPQAGDLVVWRGHVGIVIDPKQHSFFSSVRSGPDTQFYDSPYWRSRGFSRTRSLIKPLATVRKIDHLPDCQSRHLRLRPLPPQRKPPLQQPSKPRARSFCEWPEKILRQTKSQPHLSK